MRILTACGLMAAAILPFSEIAEAKESSRSGSYHLTSTGPWPMRIRARSGEACSAGFRAGGKMIFKRLFLVSAPQHGSISLKEGGHYTYSAKAGYRGPGSFMLRICGNESGMDGCADLKYAVTIE